MKKLFLATAALLLLAAPAMADDCINHAGVAAALSNQDPKISLGADQPAAAILRKVENVFGKAPNEANDKVAAIIFYDGKPAGVVFFDKNGCAADSIIPGPSVMAQVLAQP